MNKRIRKKQETMKYKRAWKIILKDPKIISEIFEDMNRAMKEVINGLPDLIEKILELALNAKCITENQKENENIEKSVLKNME